MTLSHHNHHVRTAQLPEVAPWDIDEHGDQGVYIPDVCGPSWWRMLHGWAEAIRDEGCPSCGEFAVQAVSALHDLVNLKLGKSLHDRDTFVEISELYARAKETLMGVSQQSQEDSALTDQAIELDVSGAGDFVSERVADPGEFDPEGFRTETQGDHRIVIGCPTGEWDARFQECSIGTRAHAVLHPRSEETELVDEAHRRGVPVEGDRLMDELEEMIQIAEEV